jgi:hypothetical protein
MVMALSLFPFMDTSPLFEVAQLTTQRTCHQLRLAGVASAWRVTMYTVTICRVLSALETMNQHKNYLDPNFTDLSPTPPFRHPREGGDPEPFGAST